jgi:hypothetical protein
MKQGQQRAYGSWEVFTFCREDNPEDWNPGDPIRYAAGGFAEYRYPHIDREIKWSSKARQDIADRHFYDYNGAHDQIEKELRDRINALKG